MRVRSEERAAVDRGGEDLPVFAFERIEVALRDAGIALAIFEREAARNSRLG